MNEPQPPKPPKPPKPIKPIRPKPPKVVKVAGFDEAAPKSPTVVSGLTTKPSPPLGKGFRSLFPQPVPPPAKTPAFTAGAGMVGSGGVG